MQVCGIAEGLARWQRRGQAVTNLVVCLARKQRVQIQEVLPKAGLVYSERGNLTEVLCKPKIMPIKSATLLRIEEIEKQARAIAKPATADAFAHNDYRPS
ncbi:hypothetical protein BBJ28_00014230 [Nothophytophthora sp. Chile5]|nr:hypothetical protein BBJ28_00014230 [Nothophytophthora sp. Chile5]